MEHKDHLHDGNYYRNKYTGEVKFIAGYKGRDYVSEDDGETYTEYWANLWKIECSRCVKRLISAKYNREEIAKTDKDIEATIATLRWGENFTPETLPDYAI